MSGIDMGERCAAPAEFVRLRYFFGQRLGVVDLVDEQSYHAGKHRFHNARAHGTGVLCGLRAERFVFPQAAPPDEPTTILRVRRGAAIDARGREVIVGIDQCIDVAAWFAHNRERPDVAAWFDPDEPEEPRLWVALRYRECPSDPSPAPRDPCGCEAAGCEYGRVREAFELVLLTAAERVAPESTTFPACDALAGALSGTGSLTDALNSLVAADCPDPPDDSTLHLATFTLSFTDDPPRVIDISEPDNQLAERVSLLSTSALQCALLELAEATRAIGALGPGPTISGLTFESSSTDAGTLQLPIALVEDDAGSTPLAEATFDAGFVSVHRFEAATGWSPVAPISAGYKADPPHITMSWAAGLTPGAYRVVVSSPAQTPIADIEGRPLSPQPFARPFTLALDPDESVLILATKRS